MKTKKRYLYLDNLEWRLLLLALNRLRNKLITHGEYTDLVDDLILKMAMRR